ncbi:pentapeptide repeat-containing protein [Streptomyces sp. NPDC054866]
MAHLADADRAAYFATLRPGDDVDHRGTTFTEGLLDELLNALCPPVRRSPQAPRERRAQLGRARFTSATFNCNADFGRATFHGFADFGSATLNGEARFYSALFMHGATFEDTTLNGRAYFNGAFFNENAWFKSAVFNDQTEFGGATIKQVAWFELATFTGDANFGRTTFTIGAGFEHVVFKKKASFGGATFNGDARFGASTFSGDTDFGAMTVIGDARFEAAVFEEATLVGPLVCAGRLVLSGASFGGAVSITAATRRVECRRTRWSSRASLELRYAGVDLAHAVFEYPFRLSAAPTPFARRDGRAVSEEPLDGAQGNADVRLLSLRGVDAAHLVLADLDLARCLFTGAVHLDQIRLEGSCTFDTAPTGTSRQHRHSAPNLPDSETASSRALRWPPWLPVRFTQRGTLAEEHAWRARQPRTAPGWNPAIFDAQHAGPAQLAPIYRALRKAFEDSKNEPGAADFYYGEMEMRRHDAATKPAERCLLTAYWALSGYGLRAARALAWLGAALLVTLVLIMGLGLPDHSPRQTATGTVPAGGGRVSLTVDKPDPKLTSGLGERFTTERFDKSVQVVLNSVVFRSSGQDLTTVGTYTEMVSRFTEPVLLALAILAMRARIKR